MSSPFIEQLQTALGADFSVERELDAGGMSRVFVAHEKKLARDVVVKVLSPELAIGISADRFAREIQVLAKLQEPHIVPIYAAGLTADGLPYFTMPYVRGESLRHRLEKGPIASREAIEILRDIGRALAFAHANGVVHRDIKPENVLLNEGTAVVTDFGIAKAVRDARGGASRALTASGTSIGTPAYMSPEQAAADPEIDLRADIYSWGMIAYELLSGSHAFAHRVTPRQLLTAQMSETPADLRDERFHVPGGLAELVMRCLAKEPSGRPASMHDVLAALEVRPSIAGAAFKDRRVIGVAIAAVAAAFAASFAITRQERAPSPSASVERSIAVMPFTVIGRDSAEEYLADGMTDELALGLSKVSGLRVAAFRSTSSYKRTSATPAEVGRALNVAMLLDGTVQRVQDRIRVRAQLTAARDASVLWSDSFEGNARDLFALQDTITSAVVGRLRLTLAPSADSEQPLARPKDWEAHDLYLRGRFEASRHTEAGLRAAIGLFEQAAKRDSTYAAPWVGIADAYGWMADAYLQPRDAYPKAKAAVTRAIALTPNLAEAHAVLAWILLAYDWNFIGAESEARRAVILDPTSPLAHSNYSYALIYLNHPDSALAEIRRAIALDPLSPALSSNLEWHLFMTRRYEAAVEQHKTTKRLDPGYFFSDSWAAAALRELGRFDESVAEYRKIEALHEDAPLFGLGVTYARMGDTARARAILNALLARSKLGRVNGNGIAQIYASLGDRERAIEWLERAYASRSNGMLETAFESTYDPLRSDPRFRDLLRRVGLER